MIIVQAQLLNCSSGNLGDMNSLRAAITRQIREVYTINHTGFLCGIEIRVSIIQSIAAINRHSLLFCVMDEVRNGNPAEADFKGLRIALNRAHIPSIISDANTRTIPHELGHIFGWEHPHDRGKYESVNPKADKLFEQSMTEVERKRNLMSQTWYIQTAGLSPNEGKNITFGQLELVYRNFQAKKLNNNYHVKGLLWWKRLV